MAKFHAKKRELERLLLPPVWPEDADAIPEDACGVSGLEAVSPLIALLPRGGLLMWRAAIITGRVLARLAQENQEGARIVIRRLIWHLNEDSGNIGWGVPQALGEILAQSPELAAEYGKIALSYVRDTGFADNFIEHAPLRRGAYWAIGRFAPLYPQYRTEGKELLVTGLHDEDAPCRGIAAWGMGNFAAHGLLDEKEKALLAPLLEKETANLEECEILEGLRLYSEPACALALRTRKLLAVASPS
ncbi:MAG: hypothetical protein DELT_00143 [Desulfovibrio sp.]